MPKILSTLQCEGFYAAAEEVTVNLTFFFWPLLIYRCIYIFFFWKVTEMYKLTFFKNNT